MLCREDYAGAPMRELAGGRYGSPLLQTAIRAAATLPDSRSEGGGGQVWEDVLR